MQRPPADHEIAGTESDAAGIELKSFTRKDTAAGESREHEIATRPEVSVDVYDQQPELPTDTEQVETTSLVQTERVSALCGF